MAGQPAAILMGIGVTMAVGCVIGSFLATVAIRWPHGCSVARGRSRCDRCATPVPAHLLVPLLSFLMLRGHCSACGAPISRVHPAMELGGGAIGALAFAAFPQNLPLAAATMAVGWLLLLLAALDLLHLWLPDALTAALGLAGLGVHALGSGALGLSGGIILSLAGAAAGFGSLWAIAVAYRALRGRQGLGAGDPKLFAAIGAWTGPLALPWVLTAAAFAGLAVAAVAAVRGHGAIGSLRIPFGTLLAPAGWAIWIAINLA